jgi:Zn-dependent peptidase ImmA (M78 family)/DNA-binding XRE family transcriptional regulator
MFTPSRLTLARKRRGMTKMALASAAHVGVRTVVAYESGELEPSAEAVSALAQTLAFPPEFFSRPEVEDPPRDSASFRAFSHMTAGQRDAALSAGTLAMEVAEWVNRRFQLPAPSVPSLAPFEPEAAAEALRAEWGLGERPIRNTLDLLELHGVRVFSLPADCASVNAFSLWRRDIPYVFLTTARSGERGRFDAAHELGHLVLHRNGGPRGRLAEAEANRFAAAFLMPRGSVLASGARFPSLDSLVKLKKGWLVSVAALAHRLREVGLVTEWHYRTLCIEIAQRGYRKDEPAGIPREISQVLTKVFTALREERLTGMAVARDLAIHPTELSDLVFGLAMVLLPGGATGGSKERGGRRPGLRLA